VVPAIPVDVVNVKLTAMDWDETTLLTGVFLVECIWVLVLDDVTFIDCLASIPARDGIVLVSEFDLSVTTD
jgi:hypothetical protein